MKKLSILLVSVLLLSACSLRPTSSAPDKKSTDITIDNTQQSFVSNELGINIFFPKNWSIDSSAAGWLTVKPDKQSDPNINPDEGTITITVPVQSDKSVDEYFAEINPSTGTKNNKVFKFVNSIKVGKEQVPGVLTQGGCCGLFGKHVFTNVNGKLYQITLRGSMDGILIQNEDIYTDIIKNIKFIK